MLAEDVLAGILRRPHRDALRNAIAALGGDTVVPAAYYANNSPAPRKLRLVGSTGAVLDDWRTTTDAGRFAFPGATTGYIDFGNYAGVNGTTALTASIWFTAQALPNSFAFLFGKWNGALGGIVFGVFVKSDGSVYVECGNASAVPNAVTAAGVIVAGTTYKLTLVYNTAAANGSKVLCYLSTRAANGTWSADSLVPWSTYGAGFDTLGALATSATVLRAGYTANASSYPFQGFQDEIRLWSISALTLAAIQAETLNANPTAANLRYTFASGAATNTGTDTGFNGTVQSGVVPCSDDLSYGPPILFTSRPAWVQNAQGVWVMRFDGVSNIGSTSPSSLFDISTAYSLAIVAAMNNAGASVRNPAAIADSSSGNRILGFNTAIATNNNIRGVQGNPTATFADSTIAESATMRCAIVSKDATTSVAIDVPNHARVSAVAGGSVGAGNNALAIGNYWNGSPAANWQSEDVVSLLAISKQVSAADVAAISALAQSAAQAVAA